MIEKTATQGEGRVVQYFNHWVYSDGEFIFDPRFSDRPFPKDDYFRILRGVNPDGFNVLRRRIEEAQ